MENNPLPDFPALSSFESSIKSYGRPILPPLLSDYKKKKLKEFKDRALQIEKLIAVRKGKGRLLFQKVASIQTDDFVVDNANSTVLLESTVQSKEKYIKEAIGDCLEGDSQFSSDQSITFKASGDSHNVENIDNERYFSCKSLYDPNLSPPLTSNATDTFKSGSDTLLIESYSSDDSSIEANAFEIEHVSLETVISNNDNLVCSCSDSIAASAARSSDLEKYMDLNTDDSQVSQSSTTIAGSPLDSRFLELTSSVPQDSATPNSFSDENFNGSTFIIRRPWTSQTGNMGPVSISLQADLEDDSRDDLQENPQENFHENPQDNFQETSPESVEGELSKSIGWVSKVVQKAYNFMSSVRTMEEEGREGKDNTPRLRHVRRNSYTLDGPSEALVSYHSICRCDMSPFGESPCLSPNCCKKDLNITDDSSPARRSLSSSYEDESPPSKFNLVDPTQVLNIKEKYTNCCRELVDRNIQTEDSGKPSDFADGNSENVLSEQRPNKERINKNDEIDLVLDEFKKAHSKKVEEILYQQHVDWLKLQEEFETKVKLMQQQKDSETDPKKLDVAISELKSEIDYHKKISELIPNDNSSKPRAEASNMKLNIEFNTVPKHSCDVSRSKYRGRNIKDPGMIKMFEKLSALVKGYLTRRLFKSRYVEGVIDRLKDIVRAVEDLKANNSDNTTTRLQNLQLYANISKQLNDAHDDFYNIFFNTSIKKQMKIIAGHREWEKLQQLKHNVENASPKDWLIHPYSSTKLNNFNKKPLSSATLKSLERKKREKQSSMRSNSSSGFVQTSRNFRSCSVQSCYLGTKSTSPQAGKNNMKGLLSPNKRKAKKSMSPYLKKLGRPSTLASIRHWK